MKIGLNGGGASLGGTIADAQRAESEGFTAYSMAGDSTATLALIGSETESIRLLTAVVPIFGIHPAVIAGQARVAHEASGGRFTLGIGLAHAVMVEGRMGISFDRPAARMREYLQILMPLLRGEGADVHGEFYTYTTEARGIGEAGPVSCGIAALAPVMLRLAGELAGGTVLWMANAAAIEDYIKPRIDRAAANANAGQPEIITSLPIALTDDVRARARRRIVSSRRTEHCRPTVRSSIRAALRTRETRRSSATRRSSTPSSIALRRRGSRSSMPRSSVRNREARAALGSTSRTGYGAGTASDSPRAGSTTLS